jgi:hypothetical protein
MTTRWRVRALSLTCVTAGGAFFFPAATVAQDPVPLGDAIARTYGSSVSVTPSVLRRSWTP